VAERLGRLRSRVVRKQPEKRLERAERVALLARLRERGLRGSG
jgi:hypothetical protein